MNPPHVQRVQAVNFFYLNIFEQSVDNIRKTMRFWVLMINVITFDNWGKLTQIAHICATMCQQTLCFHVFSTFFELTQFNDKPWGWSLSKRLKTMEEHCNALHHKWSKNITPDYVMVSVFHQTCFSGTHHISNRTYCWWIGLFWQYLLFETHSALGRFGWLLFETTL